MTTTAAPQPTITESALQDAYARSGLEKLGISFDRALTIAPIRNSLTGMVRAEMMWAQNARLQGARHLEHQTRERDK